MFRKSVCCMSPSQKEPETQTGHEQTPKGYIKKKGGYNPLPVHLPAFHKPKPGKGKQNMGIQNRCTDTRADRSSTASPCRSRRSSSPPPRPASPARAQTQTANIRQVA